MAAVYQAGAVAAPKNERLSPAVGGAANLGGMIALRRRFLALLVVVLGFASAGCFELGEVAVENQTADNLILWTSQVECDFNGSPTTSSTVLAPGERETVLIFETDLAEIPTCIAVAGPGFRLSDRQVVTYEAERGNLYAVTGEGTALRVQAAGPHEEEFAFDFRISTTVLLVFGLPLLAGAVAALVISIKFFVDWGKRPQTGWS